MGEENDEEEEGDKEKITSLLETHTKHNNLKNNTKKTQRIKEKIDKGIEALYYFGDTNLGLHKAWILQRTLQKLESKPPPQHDLLLSFSYSFSLLCTHIKDS